MTYPLDCYFGAKLQSNCVYLLSEAEVVLSSQVSDLSRKAAIRLTRNTKLESRSSLEGSSVDYLYCRAQVIRSFECVEPYRSQEIVCVQNCIVVHIHIDSAPAALAKMT